MTGIASASVFGIFALGLGLIFTGRGHGIMDVILGDNPGGMFLRRLNRI